MHTYNTIPQPRLKRVIKTVTRTFDENENMIEEREEEETEYEYVSWPNWGGTVSGGTTYNTGGFIK